MTLTLVHINDAHGHYEVYARAAALARAHGALLVDAGDALEPSSLRSAATRGSVAARLWRAANVAAVTVGNAEILSYGPANLKRMRMISGIPILVANLSLKSGRSVPGTNPWTIVKHKGRHVALFGLTAPLADVYDRLELRTLNPLPVAAELAQHLRRKADVVIALSHLGLWDDRELSKVPGVDLVIGGHSHHRLEQPYWTGESPIVQAARGGQWIGRVKFASKYSAAHLLAAADVRPDAEVLKELSRIDLEVKQWTRMQITNLQRPLSRDRLGQKLAETLRDATAADGAFLLEGSVVCGLPKGLVDRGILHRAYPFAFKASVADITGDLLLKILERAYHPSQRQRKLPVFRGQRSGGLYRAKIRVRLDLEGRHSRIRRAKISGKPLRLRETYRIATSDLETVPLAGLMREQHVPVRVCQDTLIADLLAKELQAGNGCV